MYELYKSRSMREEHLRYILAAALVVVAGYGVHLAVTEQAGGPPAGQSPATTPTPTPVPTTETPPEQLAPGLTWDGVVDPWNLSHAHANALLDTSFSTSAVIVRWSSDDRYATQATSHVRVAAGGSPMHFARNVTGDDPGPNQVAADVEVWREGDVSYVKTTSNDATNYHRTTPSRDLYSGPVTAWDAIYSLFAGVNTTTVERVERDGTTLYRVVSTSQPESDRFGRSRSNYSLSALVDSSGLVHRYRVSSDVHEDDRTLHLSWTWRLSAVGSTTVEQPPWVEEAKNATADRGS